MEREIENSVECGVDELKSENSSLLIEYFLFKILETENEVPGVNTASFAAGKVPGNEVSVHTCAFLFENAYFFMFFFFCRTSTPKRFENGGFENAF